MIAKICDRCGRIEDKIKFHSIYFCKNLSNDGLLNYYDLCPRCLEGMWEYLDNNNTELK